MLGSEYVWRWKPLVQTLHPCGADGFQTLDELQPINLTPDDTLKVRELLSEED